MRLTVNFLARKPVKIMHIFEALDVVVLCGGLLVLPFATFAILDIPLYITYPGWALPSMFFIFRYRVGRREGYFNHHVDFALRPKFLSAGFSQKSRWDDFPCRCSGWSKLPRLQLDPEDNLVVRRQLKPLDQVPSPPVRPQL